MTELTQIGPLMNHLARPLGRGPWPAILVIQEWWGLDRQTRSVANRFATLGYLAVAPDLYHGELAQLGDAETAALLLDKYASAAPAELEALVDSLSKRPDCDGRMGSLGSCFGGRMSLALGLRRPLHAVCTFYGGRMQLLFDDLHKLRAPVLGLFGDRDQSIPLGTVEEFDRRLDGIGVEHEVVVYSNSGHAFFRDSDPAVYVPEAANDAWQRTVAFFAKHMPVGAEMAKG